MFKPYFYLLRRIFIYHVFVDRKSTNKLLINMPQIRFAVSRKGIMFVYVVFINANSFFFLYGSNHWYRYVLSTLFRLYFVRFTAFYASNEFFNLRVDRSDTCHLLEIVILKFVNHPPVYIMSICLWYITIIS